MADPITIVRWRDAQADPPENEVLVHTDLGAARYVQSLGRYSTACGGLLDGEPTVWCDPVPPGDDALTMGDLPELLRGLAQNDYMIDAGMLPDGRMLNDAADRIEALEAEVERLREAPEK